MTDDGLLLSLRPYQRDAVLAVARERAAGRRRVLIVAPTGAGKTWIEAELVAQALGTGRRALVLAHREELVEQHERLIRTKVAPALERYVGVAIEQASRRATPMDEVVVGSVPTLGGPRCRRFEYLGRFGLVILDEAHHAAAETYQRVLTRAACFEPDGPLLVGFTATPQRADGIGLGHIFETIAYQAELADLTAQGYLRPMRAYSVDTAVVLDRVRVRAGDYDERALSEAVNTPARNGMAVSAYRAHAHGRSAIVFCVDRRHVADMTAAFVDAGIAAAGLTGDMPRAERQAILERYRRREISVLVNCAILTEGVDLPLTSAIVLARPTRSLPLLAQQVGRALRLPAPAGAGPGAGAAVGAAPGDAVILDLVDSTADAGLRTVATLVGLPPKLRFRGELVLEAKRRIERALERAPWTASAVELGRLVTVQDVLEASREVNLLYAELPMPAAFERARFAWIAVPPQRWVVSTPLGTLMIRQTVLDYRVVWTPRAGDQADLGATHLLEDAIAAAEAYGRAAFTPETLRMVDRRAPWRTRPATERQRALLDRLGIAYDEQTTADAASRAIERRLRGLHPSAMARLMPRRETT